MQMQQLFAIFAKYSKIDDTCSMLNTYCIVDTVLCTLQALVCLMLKIITEQLE